MKETTTNFEKLRDADPFLLRPFGVTGQKQLHTKDCFYNSGLHCFPEHSTTPIESHHFQD